MPILYLKLVLKKQVDNRVILVSKIRDEAKLPSLREFSPTSIAQKRDTRL